MSGAANHKKKILLVSVICTSALLLLAAAWMLVKLYFQWPVRDYYAISEKGFLIPGLGEHFVPQGISYDENNSVFYVTGYRTDSEADPIYVVDANSGKLIQKAEMLLNGQPFQGHAGGLSMTDRFIYVTGGADSCLYVFSKDEILTGGKVEAMGTIALGDDQDSLISSFITAANGYLITGEFFLDGIYSTPDTHKLTTYAGDYNQALAALYSVDDSYDYGVNTLPSAVISLPDQVQGMCVDGDTIYISTSWSSAYSVISSYSLSKADHGNTITVFGNTYPLYELDHESLLTTHTIAPMSEEIELCNGRLYVMCESASSKYRFGRLISANWCWSTDLARW